MAQTQPSCSRNALICTSEDILLDQFRWENRIIVMFAQHSDCEPYQQMNDFSSLKDELLERDFVLISVLDEECTTLDGVIISDSSADDIRSRLSP